MKQPVNRPVSSVQERSHAQKGAPQRQTGCSVPQSTSASSNGGPRGRRIRYAKALVHVHKSNQKGNPLFNVVYEQLPSMQVIVKLRRLSSAVDVWLASLYNKIYAASTPRARCCIHLFCQIAAQPCSLECKEFRNGTGASRTPQRFPLCSLVSRIVNGGDLWRFSLVY